MGWNNSVDTLGVPKASVETLLRKALSDTPSFRFVYQWFCNNAILLRHSTYILPEGISKQWNGPSELIHSSLFLMVSKLHEFCIIKIQIGLRRERKCYYSKDSRLTFRQRASRILGQAFHYSPENAFYIVYLINKYISLSDICLTVHH
jgi:hypothetical protein